MGAKLAYPQVELKNKVAIVTGGNTGIGYETAKALAIMGAHTIIACRSEERGQQAIQRLKEEGQAAGKEVNVDLMRLDLASLESTKNFIENFKQKNLPLHKLICNAGVSMVAHGKTENNIELHLQLLPCMMSTEGDKRVVLVSSDLANSGVWDPNNLHGDNGYNRLKFYGNSKLYNIMTMYALQRRAMDCGITVSSLHPGLVRTEISRGYQDNPWLYWAVKAYKLGLGRSPEKGAMTTINCAVNPVLNSQQAIYYSSCRPVHVNDTARNEQFQEELWSISCDLLKDWMSPEIQSKYCTHSQQSQSSNNDGESETDKTAQTTTMDNTKVTNNT